MISQYDIHPFNPILIVHGLVLIILLYFRVHQGSKVKEVVQEDMGEKVGNLTILSTYNKVSYLSLLNSQFFWH